MDMTERTTEPTTSVLAKVADVASLALIDPKPCDHKARDRALTEALRQRLPMNSKGECFGCAIGQKRDDDTMLHLNTDNGSEYPCLEHAIYTDDLALLPEAQRRDG